MSDLVTTKPEIIQLLPNQIKTTKDFNVRPYSSEASDEEDREIERLAATLERDSQLDMLIITGDHYLVAGHRRRRAGMVINERRTAMGQPLLKLNCVVDRTGGDMRRKAIISNLQRKQLSPMDLAYDILHIREDHGWQGSHGIQKIADYLGLNFSTVNQHLRLMEAPRELQHELHTGSISMDTCLKILKSVKGSPVQQAAIIARAREIQEEDRLDKAMDDRVSKGKTVWATQRAIDKSRNNRIEQPAVAQAIREAHHKQECAGEPLPLTRKELIAALAHLEDGLPTGPHRRFLHYLIERTAKGKGTQEGLRSKFLAIREEVVLETKEAAAAPSLVC